MRERLKILYLPKWYPCKNKALKGSFIKRHGEAVSEFCQINVVYAVADSLGKTWFNPQVSVEAELNVVRVYYKKTITGIGSIDKIIKLFLFLVSIFKGYSISRKRFGKPDLVHVHVLLRPIILALYLKFFKNIKYVISEHWTGYLPIQGQYQKFGVLKKKIWKFSVKNAEVIMPASTDLGNWMQYHGLINSYVTIPNVVDTEIFKLYTDFVKSKIRIIHVSSLKDEHKNVSGIIRSVKKVYQSRHDFELFIVGNAHDYEKLKELANEEGLTDKVVTFTDRKTGEDLAKLISSGDFFILFSNYENQPCVIGEAFACGIPVLATAVGDIPAIVTKDFGRIVQPMDDDALYNEIVFLLDNFRSYDKEQLRKYAEKHFSNEEIGRKLFEIYQGVLTNKG